MHGSSPGIPRYPGRRARGTCARAELRARRSLGSRFRVALVACLAALSGLAARPAHADLDPLGPPIGNVRYRGEIGSGADTDEFVGPLLEGETLTVAVTAQRGPGRKAASLKLDVRLVDPDGLERGDAVFTAASGQAASVRRYSIDTPGTWVLRIGGAAGTRGEYVAAFRVKPARALVDRHGRLGGDAPATDVRTFSAFEGASLTATVVAARRSAVPHFLSLLDPQGAEVAGPGGGPAVESAVTRRARTTLRSVVLSEGEGDYSLRLGVDPGVTARYRLSLSLAPPRRVTSRRIVELSDVEPSLDPVNPPPVASEGSVVRFTGSGFSTRPAPAVRFGTSRAASVTAAPDGSWIDVVVPPRTGVAVVPVYVVNADGQGTARDRHFAYVPPPVVTDLLDAESGAPLRAASSRGGHLVRLVGEHFEPGMRVRVGAAQVATVLLVDSHELRFALPAVPAGDLPVTATDAWDRSGTSSFEVFFKAPPAFAQNPFVPAAAKQGVPTALTISGSGFLESDRLLVDGEEVPSTWVDPFTRTVSLPGLPAGAYSVRLVDAVGTAVSGPDFLSKAPPTIASVTVVAGDSLARGEIPLQGGTTFEVVGTEFSEGDFLTLGSSSVADVTHVSSTVKRFVAPPGAPGPASLVVRDPAGHTATAPDVARYAGFVDRTTSRVPARSATDDLSARRAAVADVDGDGHADDVVLVSPLSSSPGSRKEHLRILLGDSAGRLKDATSSLVPAAFSDPVALDRWDGSALAVGDVDDAFGPDLLVGGEVFSGNQYQQVRLFRRVQSGGSFVLDPLSSPPSRYTYYFPAAYYSPTYMYYYYYAIYSGALQRGTPQAMAIGDIDADGAPDLIVGCDQSQVRQVYYDPSQVLFYPPPYPGYAYALYYVNYQQYLPAVRVYRNEVKKGNGFVDITAGHVAGKVSNDGVPLVGDSKTTNGQPAALHCRDLALADVNRDGLTDLVVAWDDPKTVTAFGLNTLLAQGASKDSAKVATRVLLNVGAGRFTQDATATWLPAGSAPEMWHASRIAVTDLNGDSYPDLVLLLDRGLDAYTGSETHSRRALRVLRNDGSKFTDVSATALPAPAADGSDDFRGDALAVRDVDGDGALDLVVSTNAPLKTAAGATAPRLRTFFGDGSLRFRRGAGFAESPGVDTGEADDLLFVGDLEGGVAPFLLFVGESQPGASPASSHLRAEEWRR